MFTERDLRELSNVSSHQFPDRSAKWLIRQREHLEALLRMIGGEIADALDFDRVEQVKWKSPLSLTALMDLPEVLTRFIPTFDTLFLDVKATAPGELTQTGHPLGWLLTVLQQ